MSEVPLSKHVCVRVCDFKPLSSILLSLNSLEETGNTQ